jgi:hypothetical protein
VPFKKSGRSVITLTEKYCYVVGILNNLGQDPGINFLDPIWEIHRFETGEKVQYILFIHEISCKMLNLNIEKMRFFHLRYAKDKSKIGDKTPHILNLSTR